MIFFICWLAWLQYLTKLHLAISVFIIIKSISVIYLMDYWLDLDETGISVEAATVIYYIIKTMFVSSLER